MVSEIFIVLARWICFFASITKTPHKTFDVYLVAIWSINLNELKRNLFSVGGINKVALIADIWNLLSINSFDNWDTLYGLPKPKGVRSDLAQRPDLFGTIISK